MPRPNRNLITISLRGSIWQASWYNRAERRTKRISLRSRDPAEAFAELNKKRHELRIAEQMLKVPRSWRDVVQEDVPLTVAKALDDYYAEHVLERVVDAGRQGIAIRHLKAFFNTMLLRAIDIPACRAYRDARKAGRVGGNSYYSLTVKRRGADPTIRRELGVLRAAASHSLRWKRIPPGDMPTFELPSGAKRPREHEFFTHYQLATLIFEAECDLRDAILLYYYWGARRKTVEKLHVEQVKLDRNPPIVYLAKSTDPETKKRKPTVPVYRPILKVLERRVTAAKQTGGYLFGKSADFYLPLKRLCKRLGFAPWYPHALRHTRITHLMMAGENPYKVAKLVGDTVTTIERVYGHHTPDFLEDDFL